MFARSPTRDYVFLKLSEKMLQSINASSKATSSASALATFPNEILCMIVELLEPDDHIVLALTAKYFAQVVLHKSNIMERSSKPTYGDEKDPVVVCWENLLPRLRDWMPKPYHVCCAKEGKILRRTFSPPWFQDLKTWMHPKTEEDDVWGCVFCTSYWKSGGEQVFPAETKARELVERLVRKQHGVRAAELRRQGFEILKEWDDFVSEKASAMRYNRLMQYGRDDLGSLPPASSIRF